MMDNNLHRQKELIKAALEATDNYLTVEKHALAANKATNSMLHDFTYHMTRAHEALQELGVLDQHQDYMTSHVETMMKLHGHDDPTISDLPFTHVPKADYGEVEESTHSTEQTLEEKQVWDQAKERQDEPKEKLSKKSVQKARARAERAGRAYPNMIDNMWAAQQQKEDVSTTIKSFSSFLSEQNDDTDDDLPEDEIDKMVDDLDWEDLVDLYDEDELVYPDEDEEDEDDEENEDDGEDEDVISEKLSVQARIKKRQAFARTKGRRNIARKLKLRRASSMDVLKKRAKLAARRAVYSRFLRGRDKSTLSAAEKDRVEQRVKSLQYMQNVIAQKMLPKMRSIEQKRIASYRAKKR